MFHAKLNSLFEQILNGKRIRMVAVGSSNTQRHQVGMHWLDYLELGLKLKFGMGAVIVINSGVGGDTSRDVLKRFDTDVKLFKPHMTFLTIGGNDAAPTKNVSPEQYRKNIREICTKFQDIGSVPVLQTYYACDLDEAVKVNPELAHHFPKYMDILREVAEDMNVPLVDHLKRWEPLRLKDVEEYRKLMDDSFHVNSIGNMLLGVDLLRKFELPVEPFADYCSKGFKYQALLDKLE